MLVRNRLKTYVKPTRTEPMKLFRYRKPSIKTMLGVTKAKKRLKKQLGVTAAMKPLRWSTNQKRRLKRRVRYESSAGRMIRHGLPRPGGCIVVIIASSGVLAGLGTWWVL